MDNRKAMTAVPMNVLDGFQGAYLDIRCGLTRRMLLRYNLATL